MRIIQISATNSFTKEKQTFVFGSANKGLVVSRQLCGYLQFCFGNAASESDVEVVFDANGQEISFSKLHNSGQLHTVLKAKNENGWQVVAHNDDAVVQLENLLQTKLENLLQTNCINSDAVENFDGQLQHFGQVKLFAEVKNDIVQSMESALAQKNNAIRRVREYSQNAAEPSIARVQEINAQLDDVARQIGAQKVLLGEMQARMDAANSHATAQLAEAQAQYASLLQSQDEIEQCRQNLQLRDSIAQLATDVESLQKCKLQCDDLEKQRAVLADELEWKEKELADVVKQHAEKQKQFAVLQDKRSRIEAINTELTHVAALYSQNKTLNQLLQELEEKQKLLQTERDGQLVQLEKLENSLAEIRQALDKFQIPGKTVDELMETVRVDVKIDEVASQLSDLQSEIAVKESQIAEKENGLVLQMKKFHSVAELDMAVTPIKAKDTILQVLEAKYSKLETINTSLAEKQRNLERALDDYKYRIAQLENSREKMEAEKNRALLRKQEEFKREVFLNSQKVLNEDASGVFAVTANFHDTEIETLEQEIAERSADRDLLLERAAQIEGAVREIRRHMEINAAEMATLRGEKENINQRYNEIVSQNNSEAVFNYLKALNTDTSTKYLLDVQHDAVRSEVELTEMKRYTDTLRSQVNNLRARLKHLQETQVQLDGKVSSVDALISTNDRTKDSLNELGDRLAVGYEQYISVCKQMEKTSGKLNSLNAAITEAQKTVKVNETQIRRSTAKAQQYAGDDDLQKAVANFRYEVGDVESEVQMLAEAEQSLQKEVFAKRLQWEKLQWLCQTEKEKYNTLVQKVQKCVPSNVDVETLLQEDFSYDVAGMRQKVAEFDLQKNSLEQRVQIYSEVLQSVLGGVSAQDIENKRRQVEELCQMQMRLEKERTTQLELFVTASTAKLKVTAAAAEAKTLSGLKQTFGNANIVTLLIDDKIQSILSVATRNLNVLTGGAYLLEENNGIVAVNIGGESVGYPQLPQQLKGAVYVSLVLALSKFDAGKSWLVFDENLVSDSQKLATLLSQTDGLNVAVGVVA